MKQALVAPQFGFAARHVTPDAPESAADLPAEPNASVPTDAMAFGRAAGPAIVVKPARRRKPEPVAAVSGVGTAESGGDAPSDHAVNAPRAPKVFRVASMPLPAVETTERRPSNAVAERLGDGVVGGAAPSVSSSSSLPGMRRRRRPVDPLVAPVLIRHVVYEKDDTNDTEPLEGPFGASSAGEPDFLTVSRALERLRKGVEGLIRVHERLAELDELTRLRVIGSAPHRP